MILWNQGDQFLLLLCISFNPHQIVFLQKSHPFSSQPLASLASIVFLHCMGICLTDDPSLQIDLWKKMFSLWIGTIVHPETSASTHLFPIKPCISPWIWLFPAKFSLLFYKKGCTVAVFFFSLSTPLFWFWIHSHPLLPDRFLSLKPFSLSFCLLRFHFPIRKICKWTLILI